MTPRGVDFLLEVGTEDSTVEMLVDLSSNGLTPTHALRRKTHLYVRLLSPASTQRVAEVVGPSVPVSLEAMPLVDETSPGTDWLARVVGSKFTIERSIGEILEIIRSLSLEIFGTDVVRMEFEGIAPAVLNIRLCTGDMTKLGVRKVDLLNYGEKEGLAIITNPLSIFKRPKGLVCFDLDSTLVNEELIVGCFFNLNPHLSQSFRGQLRIFTDQRVFNSADPVRKGRSNQDPVGVAFGTGYGNLTAWFYVVCFNFNHNFFGAFVS